MRNLLRLRVLEIGGGIAASYCTKLLADLGADVVKIEPPGGDALRHRGPFFENEASPEASALFAYLNTSKRSVTIDVTKPSGRELLVQLATKVDAIVENKDSPQATSLALSDQNPRAKDGLTVISLSALPRRGRYAAVRGTDLNAQAIAGICYEIGEPERAPLALPLRQGDFQAALVGAITLLARTMPGRRSHRDRRICVSNTEAFASLLVGHGAYVYRYWGQVPGRRGQRSTMRPYPSGFFPCRDGFVAVHTADDVMWQRFVEVMGNPRWAHDPLFSDRLKVAQEFPEKMDEHLYGWFKQRSRSELSKMAREQRLAIAPVLTNTEVLECEQLRQRRYWAHTPSDSRNYPGAPYMFSGQRPVVRRPPRLGEHTWQVLTSTLGYGNEEIAALREAAIV